MTEMYGDTYEFLDEGDYTTSSATFQGEDVLIIEVEPERTVVEVDSPEFVYLLELGPGLSGEGSTGRYTHTQSIASASWTVSHNLNRVQTPDIVLDSAPDEICYTSVEVIDLNTLVLTFDSPVTGKAYL